MDLGNKKNGKNGINGTHDAEKTTKSPSRKSVSYKNPFSVDFKFYGPDIKKDTQCPKRKTT